MSKNQLVGAYFFEDDTVNGNNYMSMLQNFSIWEVRKLHKCGLSYFSKMELLLISQPTYDSISTIIFLTGGSEEVVQFDGFHAHRI